MKNLFYVNGKKLEGDLVKIAHFLFDPETGERMSPEQAEFVYGLYPNDDRELSSEEQQELNKLYDDLRKLDKMKIEMP